MGVYSKIKRLFTARTNQADKLVYAYEHCSCGALFAYDPKTVRQSRAWDCSDILLGLAIPSGQPGSVTHSDLMPFVFWKVKQAPTDWALAHRHTEVTTAATSDSQSQAEAVENAKESL